MQAEQFKNLQNFRAYQKQIYDYINQQLVQLPLFFENQARINNREISPVEMSKGGAFQTSIQDGVLTKGRAVNKPLISFQDIYSINNSDLNIIQHIANELKGEAPTENTLIVDAYLWQGSKNELVGPISTEEYYYSNTPNTSYIYIPFVQFAGTQNKLFVQFNTGEHTYIDIHTQLTEIDNSFNVCTLDELKLLLDSYKFSFGFNPYNLSDNTGNFLPVGVKKRTISKKILRDNSDTNITEILPETDLYKITQFFQLWTKIRSIIPHGQEYVVGSTFINNGDFAGGVGPGTYEHAFQTLPTSDGHNQESIILDENGAVSNYGNSTNVHINYDRMNDAFNGYPSNTWNSDYATNIEFTRLSQKILEKDNPGFSPYALTTQRDSPAWFDMVITSDSFYSGVDYTLSYWSAEDTSFNPNQFIELKGSNGFFYKVVLSRDGEPDIMVKDWANGITDTNMNINESTPNQYESSIAGQPIQIWEGTDLTWTRYKKVISFPQDDIGNKLDYAGNVVEDGNLRRYKIYWRLGYQNSVENIYNSVVDQIGGSGGIWPGPKMRANSNQAKQYFTGIRMNRGSEISATNKIELTNIGNKTIAKLLDDCIKILEPYDFDIPIYSKGKVDALILSQQSSAAISTMLNEIKEGLIKAITDLTDGISVTYADFAAALLPESDNVDELISLKNDFDNMFQELHLTSTIADLNQNLTNIFALTKQNIIEQPLEKFSIIPIIQELAVDNEFEETGFRNNKVDYTILNENEYIGYTDSDGNSVTQLTQNLFGMSEMSETAQDGPVLSQVPFMFKNAMTPGEPVNGGADVLDNQGLVQAGDTYYPHTIKFNTLPSYMTTEGGKSSTPIGAMYESELWHYDSENGMALRLGNPDNTNGYPGTGYGPYAQYARPNQHHGSDGLVRVKEVYRQYYNRYSNAHPSVQDRDEALQFQGMTPTNGITSAVLQNFEPLREYTLYIGEGISFMTWIYPYLAANIGHNSYMGWTTTGGNVTLMGTGNSFLPNGSQGMNYFNVQQEIVQDNPPYAAYQYAGYRVFKFYEPHWEWNSVFNKWMYRFAQPVMGTTSAYGPQGDGLLQDGVGERKYKFKFMHFQKLQGGAV